MQAVTNARSYAWGDWVIGIMRSFLSGGAAALTTGGGASILGIPGRQVWELMLINFVVLGLYRMGEFLQLHGAPDPIAVQEALNKAETKTKEATTAVQDAREAAAPPEK